MLKHAVFDIKPTYDQTKFSSPQNFQWGQTCNWLGDTDTGQYHGLNFTGTHSSNTEEVVRAETWSKGIYPATDKSNKKQKFIINMNSTKVFNIAVSQLL